MSDGETAIAASHDGRQVTVTVKVAKRKGPLDWSFQQPTSSP